MKKYFLSNSFGQVATPVYLIEDTSLEENACLWYKIPGLSSLNQIGGYGFLAFCPTRCGNEAFFKYFINEVILPFVQDIQAIIQSSTGKVWTEDDHQAIVFMSCGGEESQIRVLLEETIATKFSDLLIVVA